MKSVPYECKTCTHVWSTGERCKNCEHYSGPTDNFKPKRQEYDLVSPWQRRLS